MYSKRKREIRNITLTTFQHKQRYLTGEYDIEILTLPRIKETVRIEQSKTAKVVIPEPGLVTLSYTSKGYGSIFEDESELKWVCDINSENKGNTSLTSGKYRIIYRAKSSYQSIYTKEKTVYCDITKICIRKTLKMEKKDTRSGFGAGLSELGKTNPDVVALCADLTGSLKMNDFAKNHPERFFQVGIAEANMIGIAAGMTIGGKFLLPELLRVSLRVVSMIKSVNR